MLETSGIKSIDFPWDLIPVGFDVLMWMFFVDVEIWGADGKK